MRDHPTEENKVRDGCGGTHLNFPELRRQNQSDLCRFKASLIDLVRFRLAGARQCDTVSMKS